MSNNFYKTEKQTGFEKIEHIEIGHPVKITIIPYSRKKLQWSNSHPNTLTHIKQTETS